jgi:hypothetical protein
MAEAFDKFVSSKAFSNFVNWIVKNGPGIFDAVKSIVKTVIDLLITLAPVGLLVIKVLYAVALVIDWAGHVVEVVVRKIIDFFENSVPNALDHLRSFFHQAWSDISNAVHEAWSWIVNDVLDPIKNFFENSIPNALDHLRSFFHQAWSDISNAVSGAWNWIVDNVLNPIGDFFTTTIPGALDKLSSAWDSVWGGLKGVVNQAWQDMIPLVNGIISLINDVVTALDLVPGVNIPHITPIGQTSPAPTGGRIDHRGIHGKAAGGPVQAGVPYTVGELGREMFVPAVNGTIIPHNVLASLDQGRPRQGHGINIQSATFKNEADIDVLTRKADFAMASGRL